MANLYIITGTTKGLGQSLLNQLKSNNIIITVNRTKLTTQDNNVHNIHLDLSEINLSKINDFEECIAKHLSPSITKVTFINNAFSMGTLAKIHNLDNHEILKSFNTNVLSSFLLIKSFLNQTKHLDINKSIINISSGAATKAIDGWSVYCISKASIEMLMKNISLEYPDINCINIDPGVMDTSMQSNIREFHEGPNNEYFNKLFQDKKLKKTDDVAKHIIKEYS